ncbi:START-like domain-containing protein [Flavobacteriaceae bacterium]|nr:START-like domain-containing protein [Flavobacteriaceae bacterium]
MSDKKSFSIEYDFHASKQLLFQYLSTPSGLGEWFADNVNSRGENFSFIWDDSEENAKLIQKKNNERIRFQWEEDEEENNPYYFEFKIQVDDITNDVSLIVTDFAEEDEMEEAKMLWDNLISSLKQILGSS